MSAFSHFCASKQHMLPLNIFCRYGKTVETAKDILDSELPFLVLENTVPYFHFKTSKDPMNKRLFQVRLSDLQLPNLNIVFNPSFRKLVWKEGAWYHSVDRSLRKWQ